MLGQRFSFQKGACLYENQRKLNLPFRSLKILFRCCPIIGSKWQTLHIRNYLDFYRLALKYVNDRHPTHVKKGLNFRITRYLIFVSITVDSTMMPLVHAWRDHNGTSHNHTNTVTTSPSNFLPNLLNEEGCSSRLSSSFIHEGIRVRLRVESDGPASWSSD